MFIILITFLIPFFKGNTQVSSYLFAESIDSYNVISGTEAFASGFDDNAPLNVPLPFTFNLDGVDYNACFISPNGYITFSAAPVINNYNPLTAGAFIGAVSGLGMDLFGSLPTSSIQYTTIGTAPNRTFVVQYRDVVRKADAGAFNFQINLFETSNVITLSYGSCAPDPLSTIIRSAQVGIRGLNNNFAQGNTFPRSQSNNLSWFGNSVYANGSMRTRDTAFPDLGLTYTFTPTPPCTTPTGVPSGLTIGSTSITNNSFVGNSFTPAVPAPTNYLILRSTVNVPPNATQIPNRTFFAVGNVIAATYTVVSVSNATTFTQTGLAQNTTYFYWVIPFNSQCFGAPFYNLASMITASATTCTNPTVALPASAIGGNGFTANWNPVVGATSYAIDVATNNTFASIVPGFNNLDVGNVTSFAVTGLNPITTYFYRVRAIGGTCSINSGTITVGTTCGAFPIPYVQNFDTVTIPALPPCFAISNDNADTFVWQTNNANSASAPNAIRINRNTTQAMDDWFFTPGLNLTAGVTYRLQFRYNTTAAGTFTENLRVRYGTSNNPAGMSVTLVDFSNFSNTLYETQFVDFTPITSGTFFVGFQGYSFANQSIIFIDDISIRVAPSCFEPTDLTDSATATNTATINFTPPSVIPSAGYQYFLSTSSTTPLDTTPPTGSIPFGATSINLSGLLSSTSYFIWIRGNCGSSQSVWSLVLPFSTECVTPTIVSTVPANRCGPGTLNLTATPNAGSSVRWYAAATGGSPIASGPNFTTPLLLTTTTYFAEARVAGGNVITGPLNPILQGGDRTLNTNPTFVNFSVSDNTSLLSVDIYPIVSGQPGQIVIRNSLNAVVATYPFTTVGVSGSVAQTIPIGFPLTTGNYRLEISSMPAAGLLINSNNVTYPYTSSIASINGNGFDNNFYMYFYNWRFSTECISPRTPVTATINVPPPFSLSSTSQTICESTSTSLVTVSGAASYNTFSWSPATGVSGTVATGFVFNPSVTTTYTLTATQTSGALCSAQATITITVNPAPSSIAITPGSTTICENDILPLSASLGFVSEAIVYSQDFNGATNDWTTTNTTTGGVPANPAFTLRPSPYPYASPYWNTTFNSNDTSQFYFSNADSGGAGSVTRTTLVSPVFNLSGYATASINFWHYIRRLTADITQVQVSIDNGVTWTTVQNFASAQGAPSGFVNQTVNLNAYAGQSNVRVRFFYQSQWGYGWCIDNFQLRGSLSLAVNWTPDTDLFTDPAATIPYNSSVALANVYLRATTTRTYTATVVGFNGCSTFTTATYTVNPRPIAGTITPPQSFCNTSIPSNIVLSGSAGTIIRWEAANDAAFTSGLTPIANTTTTLTPAQMGVITNIRYFRAVLSSGVCPQVFSPVTWVEYPSTTWNGTAWSNGLPDSTKRIIFNGNFNSTGNLQGCGILVQSGTITINANHTLTVDNQVEVAGGSLIFENDASLLQINDVVNIGNIIYKRNSTGMVRFDYTYWSTPVSPQTLFNLSPNTRFDKYLHWNTATYNWASLPSATVMIPGKGYILRAPDVLPFNFVTPTVYNAQFVGVPNNGNITQPIVVAGLNDLNLIGNPYPSALDLDLFMSSSLNAGVIGGSAYFWTHNTPITNLQYNSNDYAVYNFLGGVGTRAALNTGINTSIPNGFVAAGQGFFMKCLGSGTATFTNAMRVAGNNNQFFRQAVAQKDRFWLDLYNNQGAFKQQLIGYTINATEGFDYQYDAENVNANSAVNFYSLIPDKKLTIQGRGAFTPLDEVPLGYSATFAGEITIGLYQPEGIFATQNIYLYDMVLGIYHSLNEGPYTFTTAIGTFDTRFKIVYNTETLGVTDPILASAVQVYSQGEAVIITSKNTPLASVAIYDTNGRLLMQLDANGNQTITQSLASIAQQVLLIKITTQEGLVFAKKYLHR